jgi:hypothetical protein
MKLETASKRRGPKPDTLAIPMDWKRAVKKALSKPRPPEGWPKPEKRPKSPKSKPAK